MREPFSETLDREHPVRWSPADGDTPMYLTLKGAIERLGSWGFDPERVEAYLLEGGSLRTSFAFYQIDEAGLELIGKGKE